MRDPFPNGQTVIGTPLLQMIDWVYESEVFLRSEDALESSLPSQSQSVIALPPIQRSSVWRPKQLVDLWDSIMRGLPIGMFYLIKRQREDISGTLTGRTKQIREPGYDLLDGQQRVRALLLGSVGFSVEKRCLWVDLGDREASKHPVLRITSKGQPFGYDAQTGNKLSLDERRKAREKLDDNAHPILHTDGRGRVSDRELFDNKELIQDGKPFSPQPPLPYGADSSCTFMLPTLLQAWREKDPSDPDKGSTVLRTVAGSAPSDEALKRLHEAFERIRRAEVALLCVDPNNLHPKREGLLPLFDRIGAGGTPLSGDERLYSIYKYHYPYIRDTVNQIYEKVGRVLSPTKIAATAIRIAYVQAGKGPEMPDVAAFSRMMHEEEQKKEQREEQETFQNHLKRLIPQPNHEMSEPGTLLSSFQAIKNLLVYRREVGDFWIPDVLLASLPAELWQVLLFWAVRHPKPVNLEQSREEAVRFALFWYLCVFNKEKAARWAIASIREITGGTIFPGIVLYRRFVGNGDESCAHALMPSQQMRNRLCAIEPSDWRSDADRFVVDGRRDELVSAWWWEGKKLLPWLQKEYIHRAFPDYVPLDDHEDNVPYDIDHLCPAKDWGDNWRNLKNRLVGLDQNLKDKVYRCKGVVGGGIGNLRLIGLSQNRSEQDDDVSDKMRCILGDDQPPQAAHAEEMANFAFAPEDRGVWRRLAWPGSKVGDRKWDEDRLRAFQTAVERRAAWLYERFHDDLGYGQWTNINGSKPLPPEEA